MLNRKENRLVWNISKGCNEKCEFCAFGDSIKTDSFTDIDIHLVIERLNKIKINTIDISTGDKVDIIYLKNCIQELKKEKYKINLTATAKIINLLTPDFIAKNISLIEFTYDSYEKDNHRSINYNNFNYSCIKEISRGLQEKHVAFKALIILYSHLTFKKFRNIIGKLKKINVTDVTLIRLMPVGFMSEKNYPEMLIDKKYYEEYINYCKKNNDVVLHCSFDGINNDIKVCNKGVTKISMSPSGNIYDCPWGEHLSSGNQKFYLGNILRDDIIEIINNKKNIINDNFRCEIFVEEMKTDYLYK
jgi:MoaA/NifB/PqqE/SkfB family radical SAM enzyme